MIREFVGPDRSGQRGGTRGIEEMSTARRALNLAQELLVISLVIDRVYRGRIHDKQRSFVIAVEIARIALSETLQVSPVDQSLVRNTPALNPVQKGIYRSLQIDYKIRFRRFDRHAFVNLPVELQLLGVQVQFSKQAVLVDVVIRDAHLREQIALTQVVKLLGPLKQEE